MNTWQIAVLGIVGLLAIAWIAWRLLLARSIARLERGIREFVENPEIFEEVAQQAARDQEAARERGRSADAARLEEIVEELLGEDGDRAYLAGLALAAAEERAVPPLRARLVDPRLSRPYSTQGLLPIGVMPAEECLDLLGPWLDEETVTAVLGALDAHEGAARDYLVVLLARSGAPAAVGPLAELLDRPDDETPFRFLACEALADLEDPDAAYRALVPLLDRPRADADALAAALRLDAEAVLASRDAAAPLALEDELILAAAQTRTRLPRPMIAAALGDIDRFLSGEQEDHATSATALILDGLRPDASTAPRLERALASGDEVLAYCARTALVLSDELAEVWRAVQPGGAPDADLDLLAVRAALWLAREVDEGGFSRYIAHGGGREADRALAGLELIGAAERLAVASRVFRAFGPQGVPADIEDAQAALRQLPDAPPFGAEDAAWHDIEGEAVDALAFAYVRARATR